RKVVQTGRVVGILVAKCLLESVCGFLEERCCSRVIVPVLINGGEVQQTGRIYRGLPSRGRTRQFDCLVQKRFGVGVFVLLEIDTCQVVQSERGAWVVL